MDATYRADLRELNELNFARFDAKLEQRLAELRGELGAVEARLDGRIVKVSAELRETLERGLKEQTRVLFLAWAALLIPIIGLWMRG